MAWDSFSVELIDHEHMRRSLPPPNVIFAARLEPISLLAAKVSLIFFMTSFDQNAPLGLNPRQLILRKKIDRHLEAVTKLRPTNQQGRHAHMIASTQEWIIREQPVRTLPFSLTQLIKIDTRDLGNALIEETRQLNNRYAGSSSRDVDAQLIGDPSCMDLQRRIIDWSEDIAAQIIYKLRHRGKIDPIGTFHQAYRTIVAPLDTELVHGVDRMYMYVWTAVVDMLPFKLWDGLIATPGHISIHHDASVQHLPTFRHSKQVAGQFNWNGISDALSLYGIECDAYLRNVVFTPLLDTLVHNPAMPAPEGQREQYDQMFSDILEAAPYLVVSDRSERFMFNLPGSGCIAGFQFNAGSSCAQFVFADDEDSLRLALRTTFARGGLMIGYDGAMSIHMHPWRTLETIYGMEKGKMIAYWLLAQVHERITADYLKIERYFLHAEDLVQDEESVSIEETLAYVALAKAAPGNRVDVEVEPQSLDNGLGYERFALPALRQRYFFKLLTRCGVRVEQGKGSEIKLLREAKRPFRLGNHYGNNPTIPSFLASNILKRLEVTRDEWLGAIAID